MAEAGPDLLATDHDETLAHVFIGSRATGGIDPRLLPTGEDTRGTYYNEFPNGPYVLVVREKLAVVQPSGDEKHWTSSGFARQHYWGNHDDFAIHAIIEGKWRRFGLDSMKHRMPDVRALAAALGVPVVVTRILTMCDMY